METRVTLEYPNGRQVHATVDGRVALGMEFELYGRRWRVVEQVAMPRSSRWTLDDRPESMLCRPVDAVRRGSPHLPT